MRTGDGMAQPFYTIGHSNRSFGDFVDLLRSAEVTCVADVRTVPRSRANPQYNQDALPEALAPFEIGYEHVACLGGLRGRAREVPPDVNAFWQNEGFHNYADYAMSEGFRRGLARLQELGQTRRCAVMCAEAVWWRCHRRIIADYLIAAGEAVFHIVGPSHIVRAGQTSAARAGRNGNLVYPADRDRPVERSATVLPN
jgi:uncharacterized protein (DUF488 family)